jgi:hypothetical protein
MQKTSKNRARNAGHTQIFSARDPWLQRYITDVSGKVLYASVAIPQDARDVAAGRVGPEFAIRDEWGNRPVTVATYLANRLNTQDILDVNRDPNMCLLAIERAENLSRWIGFALLSQQHLGSPR